MTAFARAQSGGPERGRRHFYNFVSTSAIGGRKRANART